MAHIANCLADSGAESTSLSQSALTPSNDRAPSPAWSSWRMQQPQTERKYQLFPKTSPLPPLPAKSVNLERILGPTPATMSSSSSSSPSSAPQGSESKSLTSTLSLRLKIMEHGLIRRRKVSVPDLGPGPMTTVQEWSMDSPTIPGRPPIHERSASAPGGKPGALEGVSFFHHDGPGSEIPESEVESPCFPIFPTSSGTPAPTSDPRPTSPKRLAPLIIPQHGPPLPPKPSRAPSRSHKRGDSADAPRRPIRPDDPPHLKGSIPIPHSAITPSYSASLSASSLTPTPISSSVPDSRSSPKPWDRTGRITPVPTSAPIREHAPNADSATLSPDPVTGHRRNRSDSASIMDRGRPRNRHDRRVGAPGKRTDEKQPISVERKVFETLPTGVKASDAQTKFSKAEIDVLHQQALGQASRFEVLSQKDVEDLSRELRQLDERTEYLRRTYTSLRAGRRNLHARICHHLRSPLVASFRSETMLKQEEALAELDASIDDWVSKLEQAENRRTRVRQKLLEHVCAAATLQVSTPPAAAPVAPDSAITASTADEALHMVMRVPFSPSVGFGNISTPPRSPGKPTFEKSHARTASGDSIISSSSASPHRVVTAHVPSTIFEQPMIEEVTAALAAAATTTTSPDYDDDEYNAGTSRISCLTREDVESIRIYADSDVYALLADVENEFTRMGADVDMATATTSSSDDDVALFEAEKELHLARSEEMLVGAPGASGSEGSPRRLAVSPPDTSKPTPLSPATPAKSSRHAAPTEKELEDHEQGLVFLTNAVFKPERPTATT